MAKFGVWANGFIQINGVNLSQQCESFELGQNRAGLDFHAHGDDTATKTSGLIDASFTARFFADFASGGSIKTLQPLFDANTIFAIIVKPASGATALGNPQWSGNFQVGRFDPLRGKHGEVLMIECAFNLVSKFVYSET